MSAPLTAARERILAAVIQCVDREGLGCFTLEDVASAAGVSRATVYRHFPGGRSELIAEALTAEVNRFWLELADAVAGESEIEARIVRGVMHARWMIERNDLLQRLLRLEPDEFLPALLETEPLAYMLLRDYLRAMLSSEPCRAGVDLDDAADYLARMIVSYIGTAGRWDLTDDVSVRRLVRTQLLGGIVELDP